MTLQLGGLRDPLRRAGPAQDKASADVALHESRLTELTALTRIIVAFVAATLLSQLALWVKLGETTAQLGQTNAQLLQIAEQVRRLSP